MLARITEVATSASRNVSSSVGWFFFGIIHAYPANFFLALPSYRSQFVLVQLKVDSNTTGLQEKISPGMDEMFMVHSEKSLPYDVLSFGREK